MSLPEVEVVSCKCGHEFEAFHNDLGTYMCPECFQKENVKVKPLDKAFKIITKRYEDYALLYKEEIKE